jgi:6-phosphogluconolactonase
VKPDILLFADPGALGRKAASMFADRSKISIAARGKFGVAISGGTTPLIFFELLAAEYGKAVRWDLTHIFWVDERCVPPEHKDSNYKGAHDALLSKVPVPPSNVHRMIGEMPPEEGAREYEKELRSFFGEKDFPVFDLVVLGVGEDGHTASLFPDAPSLAETKRLAIPVYVEELKSWRITLSLPVLNNASDILFLAAGSKKSHILEKLLGGGGDRNRYPAGLIRPVHGNVSWLVDEEAFLLLKETIRQSDSGRRS